MKHPKIRYHPQTTAYELVDKTNFEGDKNWLNLKCGNIKFLIKTFLQMHKNYYFSNFLNAKVSAKARSRILTERNSRRTVQKYLSSSTTEGN